MNLPVANHEALPPIDVTTPAHADQMHSTVPKISADERHPAPTAVETAEPKPIAKSESSPSAGSEAPVRFGLGLYVVGEWVVASSLVSQYQMHQDAAFALMQSILVTLGQPLVPASHDHVISWPFFANPNARQGREAARDYVAGVIEHLLESHQSKKLLVFGGVLPKLNQWSEADGEDFGMPRLVLPSLYKMLQEPEQKARAWSLIQQSPLYAQR